MDPWYALGSRDMLTLRMAVHVGHTHSAGRYSFMLRCSLGQRSKDPLTGTALRSGCRADVILLQAPIRSRRFG
jgi:hypothetical protein